MPRCGDDVWPKPLRWVAVIRTAHRDLRPAATLSAIAGKDVLLRAGQLWVRIGLPGDLLGRDGVAVDLPGAVGLDDTRETEVLEDNPRRRRCCVATTHERTHAVTGRKGADPCIYSFEDIVNSKTKLKGT